MDFEWNERKRREVLHERGIDFLDAVLIFDGPVITEEDQRHDYGEKREVATGMVGEQCYVVVYTDRDDVRRIITAWEGGRRERSKYQARFAGGNPRDEGAG